MATAATPTNVYISQGNGQVYLSWDLMSGATSYVVQRGTDGVNYAAAGTSSIPSLLDTGVTVGTASTTQYYYQVSSVNASGTSGYSSALTIIPSLAGALALGTIRLYAQQRADRVNSTFVTPPEWNSYINQSAFELYDRLVTLYEDMYVAPFAYITLNGLSNAYALPDGVASFSNGSGGTFVPAAFYKLLGVDCGLSSVGNAWVTLKKYDYIARNRFVFPNITSTFLGVFNMQYRIMGGNIEFIPVPAGNQVIRFRYIPRMQMLLQDTDILDGISGWSEYVIVDAAIKALQKEESDVSELMAQKEALIKRIEESASNRDAGQPDSISETRTWAERNGGYGGMGYDGGYAGG